VRRLAAQNRLDERIWNAASPALVTESSNQLFWD
jgi:hypothetical protein